MRLEPQPAQDHVFLGWDVLSYQVLDRFEQRGIVSGGWLATADKEIVFLEIVEYIEFHSDEQFDITTLVKMIEKELSKKKVLYFV